MINLERAIDYADQFMKEHPEYTEAIKDLFDLMKNEIDEGGSVESEIDSFISACDDLLTH